MAQSEAERGGARPVEPRPVRRVHWRRPTEGAAPAAVGGAAGAGGSAPVALSVAAGCRRPAQGQA